MEDVTEKIVKLFGLQPKSYSKQKLGVYIETDSSAKIIKKTLATRQQLMFSHVVKEHLFSSNFENIDRYFKSLQNLPYVNLQGSTYIMTQAFISESEPVNLANFQELAAVTKQLATMHKILTKASINIKPTVINNIETTDYYKKRIFELMHIKKWIDAQSHLSDFDILFIKNYKYYLKRINAAFELSKQVNYKQIVKDQKIAHNAFKEQNIKKYNDDIIISNFEKAAYGSSITDLVSLLKNYIKKETFSPYFLKEIINIYKDINNITHNELNLLKTMLIYPSKYNRLVNHHYNKRKTWISDASKTRLQFCLAIHDRQESAIEQILRLK